LGDACYSRVGREKKKKQEGKDTPYLARIEAIAFKDEKGREGERTKSKKRKGTKDKRRKEGTKESRRHGLRTRGRNCQRDQRTKGMFQILKWPKISVREVRLK